MKTWNRWRWRRARWRSAWARGYSVSQAQPPQPHMQNALASLQAAAGELRVALHAQGGHRAKALALTNQAITEVQAGIAVGAGM